MLKQLCALALILLLGLGLGGCPGRPDTTGPRDVNVDAPNARCVQIVFVNGKAFTISGGAGSSTTIGDVTFTFNQDCSISTTTVTTTHEPAPSPTPAP